MRVLNYLPRAKQDLAWLVLIAYLACAIWVLLSLLPRDFAIAGVDRVAFQDRPNGPVAALVSQYMPENSSGIFVTNMSFTESNDLYLILAYRTYPRRLYSFPEGIQKDDPLLQERGIRFLVRFCGYNSSKSVVWPLETLQEGMGC